MNAINHRAVDNFIASVEVNNTTYIINEINATRDYIVYNWTAETLYEVLKRLEKMYDNAPFIVSHRLHDKKLSSAENTSI